MTDLICEHGFATEINRRWRRSQEDAHIVTELATDPGSFFLGVYDGHAGARVAQACEQRMHSLFLAYYTGGTPDFTLPAGMGGSAVRAPPDELLVTTDTAGDPRAAYDKAYAAMDYYAQLLVSWGGACVATAFVQRAADAKLHVYAANAGDSRAVLVRGPADVAQLTHDHRPDDPAEVLRVRRQGGHVIAGRVNATLAVTRAIGDAHYKPCVCSIPFYSDTEIDARARFLVIACDGVWDVLSNEDVGALLCAAKNASKSCTELAKQVMRLAIERDSRDNITVIVARLGTYRSGSQEPAADSGAASDDAGDADGASSASAGAESAS